MNTQIVFQMAEERLRSIFTFQNMLHKTKWNKMTRTKAP